MIPFSGGGNGSMIGFWSLKVPAGAKATNKLIDNPSSYELVHVTTGMYFHRHGSAFSAAHLCTNRAVE